MRLHRRSILLLMVFSLLSVSFVAFAYDKKKSKKSDKVAVAAVPQMEDSKRALHALNRLTFGPRPGDLQKVDAMGVDNWIEQQLHPEKIADGAIEARLAPFRTLKMSTREMITDFPPPQVLKAAANGRMSVPSDPQERAIYQNAMERYQQKKNGQNNNDQANNANPDDPNANAADNAAKKRRGNMDPETRMYAEMKAEELLNMEPDQRMKETLKMSPEERQAMVRSLNGPERERMVNGMTPKERETLVAMANPQAVIVGELTQAKLLRAIYSERQLDEVMTDFWMNHFNVFINKGADRYLITSYERDVIRPRALGKFKDLLVATAKSPAMLFYLDNWLSVGPNSDFAKYGGRADNDGMAMRRPGPIFRGPFGRPRIYDPFPRQTRNDDMRANRPNQQQAKAKKVSGLNENYAREIMELHTLGVNGGYTQKDVTELARVLTGWSIRQPQRGGDFFFNDRTHDRGTKHVLGHDIKEDGEGEGMKMLDILAHHPSTANFISRKLAMRFVSDDPPQALVNKMADTFMKTDGDIREVLRTMFRSQEFWAPEAYRAKVKTPLEFVVSAVRATGADVDNPQALNQMLQKLGMPLYGMQPPTGYSMKADAWVNSSALINRMNFALALGAGRLNGIHWEPQYTLRGGDVPSDPAGAVATFEGALLSSDVSKSTHETVLKQAQDPQVAMQNKIAQTNGPNVPLIAGLIMGSPEFQRR
jgi:uncharacterized protein (DUF1800 family)